MPPIAKPNRGPVVLGDPADDRATDRRAAEERDRVERHDPAAHLGRAPSSWIVVFATAMNANAAAPMTNSATPPVSEVGATAAIMIVTPIAIDERDEPLVATPRAATATDRPPSTAPAPMAESSSADSARAGRTSWSR